MNAPSVRTLLTSAALFALAVAGRGDLTVKQQVEGVGQTGEMTIRIKGRQARADLVQPMSTIIDGATGETILLLHPKKNFTRVPAEQTRTLTEQIVKSQAGAPAAKLVATGQRQKLSGHDTELFLWNVGALKLKFWVAKDFPNGPAIQQQLDELQNSGLAAVAASMMPKASDLPGVRLRTEFEMGGQKASYTITSIAETPVDAAVFDVPKDYKETPLKMTPEPAE